MVKMVMMLMLLLMMIYYKCGDAVDANDTP